MSLYKDPGVEYFPELTFCVPAFFYVRCATSLSTSALGSASALTTSVFIVDACYKLGHTGKLQGLSKFTCPAFQANVFDIEQWNDSARFSSVRLECS